MFGNWTKFTTGKKCPMTVSLDGFDPRGGMAGMVSALPLAYIPRIFSTAMGFVLGLLASLSGDRYSTGSVAPERSRGEASWGFWPPGLRRRSTGLTLPSRFFGALSLTLGNKVRAAGEVFFFGVFRAPALMAMEGGPLVSGLYPGASSGTAYRGERRGWLIGLTLLVVIRRGVPLED